MPRNQFNLMQEQAKAELEKIQAAKEKKEQKEQEKVEKAKAKEEKNRQREEKKRLKEEAQAKKAKKAAEKKEKATGSEKGDEKVPGDMETQPGTPPKTPKRAAALVATPRQKDMVKRRRQKVAADEQCAPSGSTPNVPLDEKKHTKDLALLEKIKTNHGLLKKVLDFAADVHYFPTLEDNPGMKSFTVHPYAESRGQKSIGVILFRSSFYVYRANIPDGLQGILDEKGIKGAVKKDSNGGCSLGWTRFQSVKQACLIFYMLFFLKPCA